MAISSATIWEVRTAGSDNNGGAFVSGASGTDRSQQDAAHATLTTASTVHTTTTQINVAVGDYTVVAGDVGNILQITGGTATAGFYEITAVDTGNNRWTLDRSAGTAAQTVVGAMGGALVSPGKAMSGFVAGNGMWIKSGTYTITTASTNVAGGCISLAVPGNSTTANIEGYNATRGDEGTAPVLQLNAGVSSATIFTATGSAYYYAIRNLTFDGASQTGSTGFYDGGGYYSCRKLLAQNCTSYGLRFGGGSSHASQCRATGCSGTAAIHSTSIPLTNCVAHDNTTVGISCNGAALVDCLSFSNSGASSDGFAIAADYGCDIRRCTSYGNGRDGFRFTQTTVASQVNSCVAEGNGGYGFNSTAAYTLTRLVSCATYNNTSGASNNLTQGVGFVTGSGSFFVDAAGDDFRPNATANAGALLRGAAVDIVGQTNDNTDIGAVQHADPAGGGSRSVIIGG